MSYHPLEVFGFAGCIVGVLVPGWIGLAIVIAAGPFLLYGQTLRHRKILSDFEKERHDH